MCGPPYSVLIEVQKESRVFVYADKEGKSQKAKKKRLYLTPQNVPEYIDEEGAFSPSSRAFIPPPPRTFP